MNKQEKEELITFVNRAKEDLNFSFGICQKTYNGYVQGNKLINYIEHLYEPQKVKVPAFVAEWFEINKEQLEVAIWDLTTETYETDRDQLSEIQLWIKESDIPYKTLISMQDGYEVEEEPKYRVLFPCDKRKTGHQFSYLMKDGRQCYCSDLETIPELTESTIKSIDERYWPFAVPVEKV